MKTSAFSFALMIAFTVVISPDAANAQSVVDKQVANVRRFANAYTERFTSDQILYLQDGWLTKGDFLKRKPPRYWTAGVGVPLALDILISRHIAEKFDTRKYTQFDAFVERMKKGKDFDEFDSRDYKEQTEAIRKKLFAETLSKPSQRHATYLEMWNVGDYDFDQEAFVCSRMPAGIWTISTFGFPKLRPVFSNESELPERILLPMLRDDARQFRRENNDADKMLVELSGQLNIVSATGGGESATFTLVLKQIRAYRHPEDDSRFFDIAGIGDLKRVSSKQAIVTFAEEPNGKGSGKLVLLRADDRKAHAKSLIALKPLSGRATAGKATE